MCGWGNYHSYCYSRRLFQSCNNG
ncbi:MAG: hypothetical protein IJT83_02225 [Victivallales bacterium]|nr:hypothetical protein [Victivallales bacterium]